MSYDLTIRLDDEATLAAPLSSIESLLTSYPDTKCVAQNQWVHEPNSSVHVELDLVPANEDDPESISSIGVGVPYSFLTTSGEQALKLCFALAEHLGWRVFDEQIGDYIHPSDIKELVATQGDFGDTAKVVLAGHTRLEGWLDHWAHAATHQSLLFLTIAIALAAVGATAIVVSWNVQEDEVATSLFCVGFPIGLAILAIKITFDAWFKRRRRARK